MANKHSCCTIGNVGYTIIIPCIKETITPWNLFHLPRENMNIIKFAKNKTNTQKNLSGCFDGRLIKKPRTPPPCRALIFISGEIIARSYSKFEICSDSTVRINCMRFDFN